MNEATYWQKRYEMLMANFGDALKAACLPPPPIMLAEKESYEAGRIAGMAAQQKPWVDLTDEQIDAEWLELDGEASPLFKRVIRKFARAIEAKLREKNHG